MAGPANGLCPRPALLHRAVCHAVHVDVRTVDRAARHILARVARAQRFVRADAHRRDVGASQMSDAGTDAGRATRDMGDSETANKMAVQYVTNMYNCSIRDLWPTE